MDIDKERAEFEKVFKLPDYVEWRENQQQYLTMPDEHRNDEFNGAWEGWQARAQLSLSEPVDGYVPTDTEILAWNERNDDKFQGNISQAKCAIDDARSMHLLSDALPKPIDADKESLQGS